MTGAARAVCLKGVLVQGEYEVALFVGRPTVTKFCPICNEWSGQSCVDVSCPFCGNRPETPFHEFYK